MPTVKNARPVLTTGRLSTRLSASDREKLFTKLQPLLATEDYLKTPPKNLEVELGMGDGLALLARAHAAPTRAFLGCEIYLNGLRALASGWHKAPAENLKATNLDARELLAALPAGSVSRLVIPFPDPWPKARHHKRRIVQASLLTAAARVLQPEGELWVITDWPSYAFHSIAQIFAHPAFTLHQTHLPASACKPSARLEDRPGPHQLAVAPLGWVETKYQTKARTAGRATWYLLATRSSASA